MSARRDEFQKFVSFLYENDKFFTAPYGIIQGTIDGKHAGSVVAYTVTFGQARTLDATLKVFSDKRVELDSTGYYERFNGTYKSVDEVITLLLGLKDAVNRISA